MKRKRNNIVNEGSEAMPYVFGKHGVWITIKSHSQPEKNKREGGAVCNYFPRGQKIFIGSLEF